MKKIKSYRTDSTDYRVRLTYKNIGKLPTALKQAHLVKIVKPDRLNVTFTGKATEGERPNYRVLNESLTQPKPWRPADSQEPNHKYHKELGYAQGESSNEVEFTVRIYGENPLSLKATLNTTRAGQLPEQEIRIRE